MKNDCKHFVALAVVLAMILTSCTSGGGSRSSDPSVDKTCKEGICAELVISEPIVLNQPADITVTISATVDYPDIAISLFVTPGSATFGEVSRWEYNAKAGQSQVFQSTITFPSEGGWDVSVTAFSPLGGPIVTNQDNVIIDSHGAVINPTRDPNPTIDVFNPVTPPPEALTRTSPPTWTPPPPVEGFTPQEWLDKCGWDVDQPDLITEWTGVSGWLNIPNTTTIDRLMEGTLMIGFKDKDNPETRSQIRIGLCSIGQGWTTDGIHEWNVELQSGVPFEAPISVRITQSGHIPIFIVALDLENHRVAGIGRLIYVKPA